MFPLTSLESGKNWTLRFDGPLPIIWCVTAPKKLAHLVALWPAYLMPKLNIGPMHDRQIALSFLEKSALNGRLNSPEVRYSKFQLRSSRVSQGTPIWHTFIEISLIFWNHPFSEKYSNSPVAVKNRQMSKMAIIGPDICPKVSCVQMWQKNSIRKCPKLLRYKVV